MAATAQRPTQAPAEAFRFEASPFELKGGNGEAGSCKIEMLARTGNAIAHWYWGSIVHDFAGMRHRDSIPIDYDHNSSDPIGLIGAFDVREGDLYLGGSLESIEKGDVADKLIRRRGRGIPYQSSIFFDPETAVFEELREGFSAEVNGRTIDGPAVIVREWDLRGVAVTTHGKDIGTESKFSASTAGAITLAWKEKTMTKTSEKSAEDVKPGTGELSVDPKTLPAPKPDPHAEARKIIGKFSEHFGQTAAAGYFAEGLTLESAAIKHIGVLSAQVTSITAERDALSQRIAAAQLGEAEGIDTGNKKASGEKPTFSGLFRQTGSQEATA